VNQCPNCKSEGYRTHPHSLDIFCAQCNYQWRSRQVLKPFLKEEVYSHFSPKGKHRVTVWLCPADLQKFSFGLSFRQGTCVFEEFAEDPYLSGCYDTPEEALEAGIKRLRQPTGNVGW
jgi:hypothetical protein